MRLVPLSYDNALIRESPAFLGALRDGGMIHRFFQMTGHVNAASQVQADIAAWISEQTGPRDAD